MQWTVRPYTPADEAEWDRFVMHESGNGTFLQTRNFLNYHPAGRFTDASLMVYNEHGGLGAVVPAALRIDGAVIVAEKTVPTPVPPIPVNVPCKVASIKGSYSANCISPCTPPAASADTGIMLDELRLSLISELDSLLSEKFKDSPVMRNLRTVPTVGVTPKALSSIYESCKRLVDARDIRYLRVNR
jgi:hypothetical protein